MTTWNAFAMFAAHGNVSSDVERLMNKEPTDAQLHAACARLEQRGEDPERIKEGCALIKEYFKNKEWEQR